MKPVSGSDGQEQNWNKLLKTFISKCDGYNRLYSALKSDSASSNCLIWDKSGLVLEDASAVRKFITIFIQTSLDCGTVVQKELASILKLCLHSFDIEGLWRKGRNLGDMTIEDAAQYLFHVVNPSPWEVYTAHKIVHISHPFFKVLDSGKFESRPYLPNNSVHEAIASISKLDSDEVELLAAREGISERDDASQCSTESTHISGNNDSGTSEQQTQPRTEPKVQECKYALLKRIGEGVFGEVYLSKIKDSPDTKQFALKKLAKRHPKFRRASVFREVHAGQLLSHEGVIRFEETFETASSVYLVMEYFAGCDLYTTLEDRSYQPFAEQTAKDIFKQLVRAVIHCHQRGIVHRDIKLENILMDKYGHTKLIDFGLCDFVLDVGNTTRLCVDSVGSPAYISPEVLDGKPYSGFKADVWSSGVVLYALLFGCFPFSPGQYKRMVNGESLVLQFPESTVSKCAKNLLSSMLTLNPDNRFSLEEVQNHDWMCDSIVTEMNDDESSEGFWYF
jgi:5'-AMP-activated protein kinase catalytic alpha subunit